MTYHAGFPRVSNHNSTDSSSALLLNLTPTEELDRESVFFDDPISSPTSSGTTTSAVNLPNSRRPVLWYQNRVIEEDIYEDLCYVNLRIGERNKEESSLEESPWPNLPHDKRDYCIRELVETEKNYIDALNMIINYFVRPLKSVLSHKDRATIFANIKDLAEIHRCFHNELFKACQSSSSSSRISQVFLSFKEKFVIYGNYCTNLPRSQALLDDLCTRSESINQNVINCQKKANDGKFKLRDLLSLPMQRILKYHLLLSELIKCTNESHEETGLKRAHDAMVDLGQYINEIKRDSETLQMIDDIQRSITDLEMPDNTELKDYGRLVNDGEVKMRSFEAHNKLKTRYIFLFDKVLLMCKQIRGDQFSYREAPILADYRVVDIGNGSNGSISASSSTSVSSFLHPKDKFDHGWLLVSRHDSRLGWGFIAKNEEIKKRWLDAFNKAYENVNPSGNSFTTHSFTLHTFTNPYSCSHCNNLLHGLFFQGYKCTICKIGVHKLCISEVRACGAPSLPPRPVISSSSPLPAVPSLRSSSLSMLNECKLDDSTSSSAVVSRSSLPPSPSDVTHVSFNHLPSGYPHLDEYNWFVGSMTREKAQVILDQLAHGTFLVRISPKQKGSFAISINYSGQVKHIRIYQKEDRYYLSPSILFDSLVDLVNWYSSHSLADTFHGLNAYLSHPCKLALPRSPCVSLPHDELTDSSVIHLDQSQDSDRPVSSQSFSFTSHQRQTSESSNCKPIEN